MPNPTSQTLIDHGETRDKVDVDDPAAVPMDADAEAAGTPTPDEAEAADREQRARARERAPHPDPNRVRGNPKDPGAAEREPGHVLPRGAVHGSGTGERRG
jgi:hypothetical protein